MTYDLICIAILAVAAAVCIVRDKALFYQIAGFAVVLTSLGALGFVFDRIVHGT